MPTKSILVVGGGGYIGSHMVDYLSHSDYVPIVLDNLITGHAEAVLNSELIIGDMADHILLDDVFSKHQFLAVMHFASFIQVGESVKHPAKYYLNNVMGTLNLLNAMLKWNVNTFIFSSSAAVYGEPQYTPIDENHLIRPINPYGHGKHMIEQVLEDFANAYDFHYASLRYFNAAGADPNGRLCERHNPETHLIPLILQAAQTGKAVRVYGRHYPTPDGTCIRDYIHVLDLCSAHLLALKNLLAGKKSQVYNLGTGQGYSVQQVIDIAQQVTQREISVQEGEKRLGDPAVLVADASKAMKELNWKPQYSDLRVIIEHAWQSIGRKNSCFS